MKVKMIIEHIIKALLKRKIFCRFELIYSHGLVSEITSLSMFLLRRSENLLSAGLAKFWVMKKCRPYFNTLLHAVPTQNALFEK